MKNLLVLLLLFSCFIGHSQKEKSLATTKMRVFEKDLNGNLVSYRDEEMVNYFRINDKSITLYPDVGDYQVVFSVIPASIENNGTRVKLTAIERKANDTYTIVLFNEGVISISSSENITVYHKMNSDQFKYFMDKL